jgi:hypothetical protein
MFDKTASMVIKTAPMFDKTAPMFAINSSPANRNETDDGSSRNSNELTSLLHTQENVNRSYKKDSEL